MTEKTFDDWDMEMSKWRGYVVRALEDSNVELKEIKELVQANNDKIDSVHEALLKRIEEVDKDQKNFKTAISVRVAEIAGAVSIITSIVIFLITKL
jgi:hypothetical protein